MFDPRDTKCSRARSEPRNTSHLADKQFFREDSSCVIPFRWICESDYKGFLPAKATCAVQRLHSCLSLSPLTKCNHRKPPGIGLAWNCQGLHFPMRLHQLPELLFRTLHRNLADKHFRLRCHSILRFVRHDVELHLNHRETNIPRREWHVKTGIGVQEISRVDRAEPVSISFRTAGWLPVSPTSKLEPMCNAQFGQQLPQRTGRHIQEFRSCTHASPQSGLPVSTT